MRESDRPPSSLAWQIDIDIGEASTSPPQGEAGAVLGLKHGDDDRQIALAWLLQRSPAMLPIPGCSTPQRSAAHT
jgi:aryl-alcohol dehydrogenase-like predicted oxidoreductase